MNKCVVSETVTSGIRIKAEPKFISNQSQPEESTFYFSYDITIFNESSTPVQLISRHWIIINSEGDREEVKGPGVIGKTPVILPGESFKYQSFCPLNTVWGTMEGAFQMKHPEGYMFDVKIERFVLVADVI